MPRVALSDPMNVLDGSSSGRGCVLQASQLSKVYGAEETRVEALRDVSLNVSRGEIVAIMGPSGSGKSTLLSLLGAMDTPTAGQVLLEDIDLATLDDRARTLIRRRRIGFVFQAFNLLPILTALENVSLPLELDGVASAQARRQAMAALELVEMARRSSHLPTMLSGGEQQRVAIARALVIRPAILLADEPTGNLDSANSRRIVSLLGELAVREKLAIVLVTHDADVAGTANRLIRLRDGKIESIETTAAR